MACNKVIYDGTPLIDLTADTVTPSTLLEGITAHNAKGETIVGTMATTVPVGTVIYYAGLIAPGGYLACDGTVYDIADYPDLAQFFADNYGSVSYWGGDGSTTFAVPDWGGEFFRAAGANPHAHQGGGGTVGQHQDATEIPNIGFTGNTSRLWVNGTTSSASISRVNQDAYTDTVTGAQIVYFDKVTTSSSSNPPRYTTRPTNTSLLVCIRAL